MTSTVSDITRDLAGSAGDATVVALVAIVLLIAVAAEQEIVRAAGGASAESPRRPFSVVIAPLFLAFLIVVVARFANLIW
jgi:hypothetical protein